MSEKKGSTFHKINKIKNLRIVTISLNNIKRNFPTNRKMM